MLALHIVLYVLLSSCLAFAIVELGLTAYVATFWGGDHREYYWDPYQGYVYKTVHTDTPGIVSFILFSAVWTILVSAAALVLPWFYTRKGVVSRTLNTILGVGFIIGYFVTSVFWLACFADIVSLLGGVTSSSDYLNAIIAFAVLLWLIFLALFILSILAVCGVLFSDWAGYQSMKKGAAPAQPQTSTVPPPDHEEPMGTAPAPVAASELSSCDAEALQNQPPTSQTFSPSSQLGIASAELSADNTVYHEHHAGHP
ncbi:uncharacterized protein N7482_001629 [Penicillium canariense]|uniref:MARVEL domain-containing protein n=1 Tax=Penicillium canariense TaxID=189055 RepID=A0A9W9IG51_9EURO|nr:uncharacterized protein N7482_001629 [Penicillium canariense]KAJ5175752.1 hypothetical protein N7482_001629 [Penicillium canariense]